MILGYARVSTEDKKLDAQIAALEAARAERIYCEKIFGSRMARTELDRLLDQIRSDEVVVVAKYDRLSRSLQDLLTIVKVIRSKGAGFRSLAEDMALCDRLEDAFTSTDTTRTRLLEALLHETLKPTTQALEAAE
jgi:DNA invertase Pin-like site-specific DNA recombinase